MKFKIEIESPWIAGVSTFLVVIEKAVSKTFESELNFGPLTAECRPVLFGGDGVSRIADDRTEKRKDTSEIQPAIPACSVMLRGN